MKNIIAHVNEDGSVLSVNLNTDIKGKSLNEFYFGTNMIDSIISTNEFLNFVNIATLNPMIPNITEVYYMAKFESEQEWQKAVNEINTHWSIQLPEEKFQNIYLFKDGIWCVNNVEPV